MEACKSVPIIILIGARQVGKTTIMKNLPLQKDFIYLDGQDPETAELFTKKNIIEKYLQVNLNRELNGYLLLDEFQFINDISTFLKLLTDHNPKLKIICSGSSSINILQKVKESLAGRARIIEIFSLSFEEYLMFSDKKLWELYLKYDANTETEIINKNIFSYFKEYLLFGGFPRIANEKNFENKIDLLDDIYKTYLLKDVRAFIRNEDFVGFNKLLRLLSAQTGNMINVNNLAQDSGLSYKKTEEYLYILEQMYIIKLLEPYHTNKRKTISKMKKVYFTDLGLRNIIYSDFKAIEDRIDNGSIFENNVFLELLRIIKKSYKINYYRTVDGSEVDFVIDNLREKISFEVKYKKFEKPKLLKNLTLFNSIENITKSYVINQNLNDIIENIHYFPGVLINKLDF